MRLIDADKLIEKLRDFKEWENDDGRPIHTMSETQRIDRCINFVQLEQTAYDVDKVVKELENELSLADKEKERCTGKNHLQFDSAKGYASGISTAIEIVKQGGISDDVCDWKSASDGEFIQNPHTKRLYSNEPSMQNVYCNTCGKKIKVVD